MRNLFFLLIYFVFFISQAQKKVYLPDVNPVAIQNNFREWNQYNNDSIMLSQDFVGLDENNVKISKEQFLNLLTERKFIPIKMQNQNDSIYYKLYKIEPKADTSIGASLMESSFNELQNFKKEGTLFPAFSFKDIDGKLIDNELLKGKTVVIKCWYIHCAACIKEFPDVNKLADEYKDRNDIVFLSLAEDTTEQLKAFLNRKPLNYLVVPNMKDYMNDKLQLNAFPTHFILNPEGKIVKVLPDFKSLEVALKKYLKG